MVGAPDFVIATVVFIRKLMSSIMPKVLTDAISEIAKQPLEWMVKKSTGRPPAFVRGLLERLTDRQQPPPR